MKGGNDLGNVLALQFGELGEEVVFGLIVKKSDRASHHSSAGGLLVLSDAVVDEFGHGLGTVIKAPFGDHLIKGAEQAVWNGDAHALQGVASGFGSGWGIGAGHFVIRMIRFVIQNELRPSGNF